RIRSLFPSFSNLLALCALRYYHRKLRNNCNRRFYHSISWRDVNKMLRDIFLIITCLNLPDRIVKGGNS
ncbi:MAG: hypothetical protein ACYSUK_12775, partial [Planctomycetota bacterium]